MRTSTWAAMRDAARDALAVLLPVECAGCGMVDRAVCDSCRARLDPAVRRRDIGGLPVWSGLDYDGVPRHLILALKAHQRTDVATRLAPALRAAVVAAASEGGSIELAPIPGTRASYRRRGYDPVALLLDRASLRASRVFAVARPHEAQKTLTVQARDHNLRGVFRLRTPVAGRRILLIDDVVTTGATLREASRVLSEAGADVVGAAVVASTRRRHEVVSRLTVSSGQTPSGEP